VTRGLRRPAAAAGRALGRVLAAGRRLARSAAARRAAAPGPRIVVDTSVLIDGRVAGVAEAGFLAGTLVVPAFVRAELRGIAGDPDPLRRRRGRRGLDTLERLRRADGVALVEDGATAAGGSVDDALLALARADGARLLTNDAALGARAAGAGVAVLSVAALAEALRPVARPGEPIAVRVVEPGREPGQGVGYLPDGTMVVIEGGRPLLGRTVEAAVTRVLQTRVGRLVFARPRAPEAAAR
jgi:uncharacterized protein YacL